MLYTIVPDQGHGKRFQLPPRLQFLKKNLIIDMFAQTCLICIFVKFLLNVKHLIISLSVVNHELRLMFISPKHDFRMERNRYELKYI